MTRSRKVSARVVDLADEQPSAFSSVVRAPNPAARRPALPPPDPEALPREFPVTTTTSEEQGGQLTVREETSRVAQPAERADSFVPQPNPEEQFLLRVAGDRPVVPLDGSVNGEAVLANYVSGDDQCRRVAVVYPARRVSEIWRVCADRQFVLERKAEPTPAVPDDPGLEASRMLAVHAAYNDGRSSVPYGPLTISAQAARAADARGCMPIRSALSWQGVPMAIKDETICVPTGE